MARLLAIYSKSLRVSDMYPAEVDLALSLSAAQIAPALLELDEGQWFERKSAKVAPKDVAIPLIAMANAEGGVIVVGLSSGRVEDVDALPGRVNALRQAAIDHTNPPVRARTDVVRCVDENGSPADVVVFRVEPGETVHETRGGECYLRVGDESRKLSFVQRQELTYDRGSSPFDGTPSGARLEELDPAMLADYVRATAAQEVGQLLAARSLTNPAGELTVAAYLLFGRTPTQRMPHAHVRVLRYTDVVRGTGSRLSLDASFDRRCEGPIPTVIHDAAEAIEEGLPHRRALGPSGRFEAIPLIPRDAWLEGLVNAVIHRSYSVAGDHVRVEIFPDRVEIESPGRFPGVVDPSKPLDIRSYARNPRIARVCADLNIARQLGEGIGRIFDEMRLAGLTDPQYEQTSQSTRLILRANAALPSELRARLPRGSERLLAALRTSPSPLGTGELIDLTGMSRPTVSAGLKGLRDAGYVEWNGKSANDPRATWSLT